MKLEKEIINLLATGKKALEICNILGVNKKDVDKIAEKESSKIAILKVLQQISNLESQKDIADALALCSKEEYADNPDIQLKKASILFRQKDYDRALEICNNPKFFADARFAELKVRIYIKKANKIKSNKNIYNKERMQFFLSQALEICSNPDYALNSNIQIHRISIAKSMNDLKEALRVSEDPMFADNSYVQGQRIDLLLVFKRLDEALVVCNEKSHLKPDDMAFKKIAILESMGRVDEALEICNLPRYASDITMQVRKISMLNKFGRYDEALAICDRADLKDDEAIKRQRDIALQGLKKLGNVTESLTTNKTEKQNTLSNLERELLDKIQRQEISLEEINTSGLEAWKVVVLTIAYYEISNLSKKVAIAYLKKQIVAFNDNLDILKIFNQLKNRLMQNVKIFDKFFYEQLLSKTIREKELTPIRKSPIDIQVS